MPGALGPRNKFLHNFSKPEPPLINKIRNGFQYNHKLCNRKPLWLLWHLSKPQPFPLPLKECVPWTKYGHALSQDFQECPSLAVLGDDVGLLQFIIGTPLCRTVQSTLFVAGSRPLAAFWVKGKRRDGGVGLREYSHLHDRGKKRGIYCHL